MKRQGPLVLFIFRWAVSSLGLWVAAKILGENNFSVGKGLGTVLGAGLILALVNMILRPLLIILSIPVIIFTVGLFMLIVNGLTILIAAWLYGPLEVKNIWIAVVAGIILAFVNFLVAWAIEDIDHK